MYKIIRSDSLCYIVLRYFTYGIQFLNSILIAKYLGAYEFGIYSFILLFQQYSSYANLGINDSLNIEYALLKKNSSNDHINKLWYSAWTLNLIISLLIIVVGITFSSIFPNIFNSYQYSKYSILIILYCAILNQTTIYITYYRLNAKLGKLNIQQILPNILLLSSIFVVGHNISINTIFILLILGNFISLLIYRYNVPFGVKFVFDRIIILKLINKGCSLLLYNMSFYFMTIIISTIISSYFNIEQFGEYSFVNSISNAINMAGGAFLFIFYPKMINKFSQNKTNEDYDFLNRIRNIYILSMDAISIISILFVPLLDYYLSDFHNLLLIYSILIMGKIINNSTSGYATYLISKSKEKLLMFYGFISILLIVLLSFFVVYLDLEFKYLLYIIPLSSLFYSVCVIRLALLSLKKKINIFFMIKEIFGHYRWIIFLAIILYSFVYSSIYIYIIFFSTFFYINRKRLYNALVSAMSILTNNQYLKI